MYNLKERDAIKRFLNEETVNTSEAIELLGFTRQYLNQLVKRGEFEPMKRNVSELDLSEREYFGFSKT
ncbi:DNA-binding protein [Bacillus velezensis]|uniref:DNA-binding protein n=1 Tax=Bacillus TaxID=1386 RepID=UPI000A6F3D46|nr:MULTISPECIES: DNA-binding protein [Bacillus]